MKSKIVIDGNSVYEVDENCIIEKKKQTEKEKSKGNKNCAEIKK